MVAIEVTAFEAMQIQEALGERLIRLNAKPRHTSHPLEASAMDSGSNACHTALRKVVEALYPDPEPEAFPEWSQGELQEAFGK